MFVSPHPVSSNYIQRLYAAGGTLSENEKIAVHDLCWKLANNGLLSSILAYYPFLGGTGTSQSITNFTHNLISSSFQLTPVNIIASMCTSLGYQGDGTSSYWDTGLIPNSVMSLNNNHIGIYLNSGPNSGVGFRDIIGSRGTTNSGPSIILGGPGTYAFQVPGSRFQITPTATFRGSVIASITNSTTYYVMVNNINQSLSNVGGMVLGTLSIKIGYANNGGFSDTNTIFSSCTMGLGYTIAQEAIRYQIEQNFQTYLGREVNQ